MINAEHANFIRNSRKFLHCGECGRPFDTDSHKPRVLTCGHNVCDLCMSSQRLATDISKCCMVCEMPSDRKAPVSHDLLGIVVGKEQAMKRVPLKYRCSGECTSLCKENDMTVCRTCSGWSEGHMTEEATDFAKRPISALMCWMCATHPKHATHDKMSIEIVNRIWDTPIAIEYVETQLGTAEKLLDLIRGGAITQITQLTRCFSESLEVLKMKVSSGQFPLESTVHIKKAMDLISSQIRNWNIGIQKSADDAHLLMDYFETLVKHVGETPSKSKGSKWEPPAVAPVEEEVVEEDLRLVIKRNIREIQSDLPIGEMKLSQTPEGDHDQAASETTTTAVSVVEEPERVVHRRSTALPPPYFNTEDYLGRPRRTTKKNYAMDDDLEEAPKKRQRQSRKDVSNGEGSSNGALDMSPYNLSGTHLDQDSTLPSPSRRGASRRGRGRRRGGFRGGRGSRGGYRHIVVQMNANELDTPVGSPVGGEPETTSYEPDMEVLGDEMGGSFDMGSDTVPSHEPSPRPDERTTEELFQELTGMASSTVSSASSGGEKSSSAEKTPPISSSSSSSSPPLPPKPPSFHMTPADFLGPSHRRDMKSPFGKKQRPWEEVTQADRYGSVSDYYQKNAAANASSVQSTFINNTPPY